MIISKFRPIISLVLLISVFSGNIYACHAQIITYSYKPWTINFSNLYGRVYANILVQNESSGIWSYVPYRNQFTIQRYTTLPDKTTFLLDYAEGSKGRSEGIIKLTDYKGMSRNVEYKNGGSGCPQIYYGSTEEYRVIYFNHPGYGDLVISKDNW